jgi:hypothetical protein
VGLADVDQGYAGERPAVAAREHGIKLEVVRLPEADHLRTGAPPSRCQRRIVRQAFNLSAQKRQAQ